MSRGFTLVELLIVVAAIAILAALFLGAFQHVADASRIQATEGRLNLLGNKVVEIRQLSGRYPADLMELAPAIEKPGWIENGRFVDAYGRPILYEVSGGSFRVLSVGRDGIRGSPDDLVFGR